MRLKRLFFLFLMFCVVTIASAQRDDFATWTNINVNHRLDSGFTFFADLELCTEDDASAIDRWGLSAGGGYHIFPFLNLHAGYETHYRNLGESEWRFRHRYYVGASASFRYQWLKVSLRERFQHTIDHGDSEVRLRSRLKLACAPAKSIISPYFSVELFQSLDDNSFWRAACMRYRPGVEIELSERWSLDAFYCYEYEAGTPNGKHIAGLVVGYYF